MPLTAGLMRHSGEGEHGGTDDPKPTRKIAHASCELGHLRRQRSWCPSTNGVLRRHGPPPPILRYI